MGQCLDLGWKMGRSRFELTFSYGSLLDDSGKPFAFFQRNLPHRVAVVEINKKRKQYIYYLELLLQRNNMILINQIKQLCGFYILFSVTSGALLPYCQE